MMAARIAREQFPAGGSRRRWAPGIGINEAHTGALQSVEVWDFRTGRRVWRASGPIIEIDQRSEIGLVVCLGGEWRFDPNARPYRIRWRDYDGVYHSRRAGSHDAPPGKGDKKRHRQKSRNVGDIRRSGSDGAQ